jgi:cytidylate kinase
MYRAVTWAALSQGVDMKDSARLGEIAAAMRLEMQSSENGNVRVWCNGHEITEAIRSPEVTRGVSEVADSDPVRRALVAQQRELGLAAPSILEGRDITTVVFPDARWKFFLEAEVATRARRRLEQLRQAAREASLEAVRSDLEERDRRDRIRPWGALRLAGDAVVLDTTSMTQDQVVDLMVSWVSLGRVEPGT